MERLKKHAEQEGPSVQEILWQKILDDEKAQPLLQGQLTCRITLLGDRDLVLAWAIWKSGHQAEVSEPKLTIIPENPKNPPSDIPPDSEIVPSSSLLGLTGQDLIIAHKIINQTDPVRLVREAEATLQERGLFYATAPGSGRKVAHQLKGAGIRFDKKSLISSRWFWPQEVVFIFSKKALVKNPSRVKSKRALRVSAV